MDYIFIKDLVAIHLMAGWAGIALGIIGGALMGMFFHREDWLGGYNSVPRRMIRLGHIAFFGMAFLNLSYALTLSINPYLSGVVVYGSLGLLLATISMPAVCLFSARFKINRSAFVVPVLGTLALLLAVLMICQKSYF